MKPECKKVDLLTLLITTFLGSGLLPKMPGTYGSFFAAAVVFPIALLLPFNLLSVFSIAIFFMAIPFVIKP
jgi:phosphatidylglycerophosphatase A